MAYDPYYGEEQFLYPDAQYERVEYFREILGLGSHIVKEDYTDDPIEDNDLQFTKPSGAPASRNGVDCNIPNLPSPTSK